LGLVSIWDDLGGTEWSSFSTFLAVAGVIAEKPGITAFKPALITVLVKFSWQVSVKLE